MILYILYIIDYHGCHTIINNNNKVFVLLNTEECLLLTDFKVQNRSDLLGARHFEDLNIISTRKSVFKHPHTNTRGHIKVKSIHSLFHSES